MSIQHMLQSTGPLLDSQGNLSEAGWSRQPTFDCNLEQARTTLPFWQWTRLKRWDYYGITTPTHFFSFTLADLGYIGTVFAYAVEFSTHHYHEETLTLPLARGVSLPRNSTSGESLYDNGRVRIRFCSEPEARRLEVRWPNFEGHDLNVDATLALPAGHESMVIVIPIRGKRFYYNRKINCLPVTGQVGYQGKTFGLEPDSCLGNLDWGRGVWEYKSFWVWASASGFLPDRRTVGLNLGFGFGDTSAATENALILDGRIHKLGQVGFHYDPHHFMHPWKMSDPDGRLSLEFTPFLERVAKTDFKVLNSEVHQMFGQYNGTVITDQGESIHLENLVGFAEEHHARW